MILSNHYTITSSANIKQICQPFFDATGLIYFYYQRLYKSGQVFELTSNSLVYKYYYLKESYKAASSRLHPGSHLFLNFVKFRVRVMKCKTLWG